MESNLKKPVVIEKEEVANLRFPAQEVLVSEDEIKLRRAELDKALKLGNVEHGKIRVVFEDDNGLKQIETTIWGVTDKRIILKHGIVLPIHRIHEIKI